MSIDPRDLFISLNPLGLDEQDLEKDTTGFTDNRTHGDYLVFLAGYKAGAVDGGKRECQRHRPINAEGGTPDNNIHPEREGSPAGLTDVLPIAAVEGDQLVIRIATDCLLHAVTCSSQWPANEAGSPVDRNERLNSKVATSPTEPDLLTPEQAAQLLGLSVKTLATWRSTGKHALPFTRCGARIRYQRTELVAWLAGRGVR
ncbi:TPA: helix-turn-helix domain-containing protein [Pseudomonas putida]